MSFARVWTLALLTTACATSGAPPPAARPTPAPEPLEAPPSRTATVASSTAAAPASRGEDPDPMDRPAEAPPAEAQPSTHEAPAAGTPDANAPSREAGDPATTKPDPETTFNAPYARVLRRFVDGRGRVDYRGLARDRGDLDAYVEALATLSAKTYGAWSGRQKLAFWINAYNALTLRLIVDNLDHGGGLRSIRDLEEPWDRPKFRVRGRARSLNDIEHRVIRKFFEEPRIHMALVCAARGCPVLQTRPYTAKGLYRELARASRQYLASPAGLVADAGGVRLSSIFDWYGDDWAVKDNQREGDLSAKVTGVLRFVRKYAPRRARAHLGPPTPTLSYIEYSWVLNDQN